MTTTHKSFNAGGGEVTLYSEKSFEGINSGSAVSLGVIVPAIGSNADLVMIAHTLDGNYQTVAAGVLASGCVIKNPSGNGDVTIGKKNAGDTAFESGQTYVIEGGDPPHFVPVKNTNELRIEGTNTQVVYIQGI